MELSKTKQKKMAQEEWKKTHWSWGKEKNMLPNPAERLSHMQKSVNFKQEHGVPRTVKRLADNLMIAAKANNTSPNELMAYLNNQTAEPTTQEENT